MEFLALTAEPARDVAQVEEFAATYGVPWSIGYGANETIRALGVRGFPTTFVIGRDGQFVWNSSQRGSLNSAIRQALE